MSSIRLAFALANTLAITPAFGVDTVAFRTWQAAHDCLEKVARQGCLTDQQKVLSIVLNSAGDLQEKAGKVSGSISLMAAPLKMESQLQVANMLPTFRDKLAIAQPVLVGAWLKKEGSTLPLPISAPDPLLRKHFEYGRFPLADVSLEPGSHATVKVQYIYIVEVPQVYIILDPSAGSHIKEWLVRNVNLSVEDLAKFLYASGMVLAVTDPNDIGTLQNDSVSVLAVTNFLKTHIVRSDPISESNTLNEMQFAKAVANPTPLKNIAFVETIEEKLVDLVCEARKACPEDARHIVTKGQLEANLAVIEKYLSQKPQKPDGIAIPRVIEEFSYEIRNISEEGHLGKIGYVVPKTIVASKSLIGGLGLVRSYVFPTKDQLEKIKAKYKFNELRPLQTLTRTEFFSDIDGFLRLLGDVENENQFYARDPQMYGLDWVEFNQKISGLKKVTIKQHWEDQEGKFEKTFEVDLEL